MGRQDHQFVPAATRAHLLASYGIAMNLDADFDQIRNDRSLTGYGEAMISQGIECLLVGLDDAGNQVLERGVQWLTVANEEKEMPRIYFPNATEAARYFAVGLGNWLLHDIHDCNAFDKFTWHYDQYFSVQKTLDRKECSSALPEYVAAGMYQRAINLFESIPGAKKPVDLRNLSAPGISYAVAVHRLRLQYPEDELRQATQLFLSREIPSDLKNNHRKAAATWMKVAHWANESKPRSAREALLRCYDYLPNVSCPR